MFENLFRIDKSEVGQFLSPLVSAGINALAGQVQRWYQARKEAKQAKMLCGSCLLPRCVFDGQDVNLQMINDCAAKNAPQKTEPGPPQ